MISVLFVILFVILFAILLSFHVISVLSVILFVIFGHFFVISILSVILFVIFCHLSFGLSFCCHFSVTFKELSIFSLFLRKWHQNDKT